MPHLDFVLNFTHKWLLGFNLSTSISSYCFCHRPPFCSAACDAVVLFTKSTKISVEFTQAVSIFMFLHYFYDYVIVTRERVRGEEEMKGEDRDDEGRERDAEADSP